MFNGGSHSYGLHMRLLECAETQKLKDWSCVISSSNRKQHLDSQAHFR